MAERRRPTIAELEAILSRQDNPPIEILPDGSIHVFEEGEPRPQGPVRVLTIDEALGDDY